MTEKPRSGRGGESDPAGEEAEKMLEELSAAGRDLLDGLPEIPVYELGRCLRDMADGRVKLPVAGDRFTRRLVDLLLLSQLDPAAPDTLSEFLAAGVNAGRLAENTRAAAGRAQAAEGYYNERCEDLPARSDRHRGTELTHLGHRWRLATLEAAFWSALSDQAGERLKQLAETAASFYEEAGEYREFLAEGASA